MATKGKLATTSCLEGVVPIISGLPNLLSSEKLSDFSIVTGDKSLAVHRVVLSLHSRVLAKACDGDFQETSSASISLNHEHPACVEAMVHYMYHFDYKLPENTTDNPSAFHIGMAVIADKYEIAALKDAAFVKCKASLPFTTDKADAFAEAVNLAYENVVAVPEICNYLVRYALVKPEVGVGDQIQPPLRKVLQKYPELSMSITEAMHAVLKKAKQQPAKKAPQSNKNLYACPYCEMQMVVNGTQDLSLSYYCDHCQRSAPGARWIYEGQAT